MAEQWEATGDTRFAILRDDVVAFVATALELNVQTKLRQAVTLLGRQMGWRPIRIGNRSLFSCVKARTSPREWALESSRELRARCNGAR